MGCIQSHEDPDPDKLEISSTTMKPRASVGGTPLTPTEIQMRIESCDSVLTAQSGSTHIKYAYVSQRGYYPDALAKPNQDSYSCIPQLSPNRAFFAVYDGHGRDGHDCAYYCRDHLHVILKETLGDGPLESVEVLVGLRRTHLSINRQLAASAIDDSLSGTTAISCLFDGDMMYVSNVGDSRAILIATKDDGKFSVTPLSNDQTPYRKDERERIKKTGARVLSMDQLEGISPVHENWGELKLGEEIDEAGDPPRVWSPYGDYPGTAFSRSIGDSIAKELGVCAEPEILARKISTRDKYVIIASDGVFEFLTNQNVADIIISKPDILSACRAVVQQAYQMWLRYEVRTDDISIIIIELSYEGAKSPLRHNSIDFSPPPIPTEIRPVRRLMSREKRRSIIFTATSVISNEMEDSTSAIEISFEKSDLDKATIKKCIKHLFLFKHLNNVMEHHIIGAMQRRLVSPGEIVIKQGDEGDSFYVASSGRYEVRVQETGSCENELGRIVHVYEQLEDSYPCFGELSLMYGSPRAATVIALEAGVLWFLDRKVFRQVLHITEDSRKKWMNTLRHVPTFANLRTLQLQSLVDLVKEESYSEQDYVIQDGSHHSHGDWLYVVASGTCDITQIEDAAVSKLYSLRQYDIFSDHFLTKVGNGHVSVVATSALELYIIAREDFELIVDSIEKVDYGFDHASEVAEKDFALENGLASVHTSEELSSATVLGIVTVDDQGTSLCVGSFATEGTAPNVSMHSIVFSKLVGAKRGHVEITRNIDSSNLLAVKEISSICVPKYLGYYKMPNVLHFVYRALICNDIGNLYIRFPDLFSNPVSVQYVVASTVSAMRTIHECGIIYRNIQPEGIHIDSEGRVMLIDFRMSKILQTFQGLITGRTFTLCGASEYIAPEQLTAGGYNNSVDFWALGVLLCELSTGVNPFATADARSSNESSQSETAAFSKIMIYGQEEFPHITFPDSIDENTRKLANDLLVANPFNRLGVHKIPDNIEDHAFFEGFNWEMLSTMDSPLRECGQLEFSAIIGDGPKDDISKLWAEEQSDVPYWIADL